MKIFESSANSTKWRAVKGFMPAQGKWKLCQPVVAKLVGRLNSGLIDETWRFADQNPKVVTRSHRRAYRLSGKE